MKFAIRCTDGPQAFRYAVLSSVMPCLHKWTSGAIDLPDDLHRVECSLLVALPEFEILDFDQYVELATCHIHEAFRWMRHRVVPGDGWLEQIFGQLVTQAVQRQSIRGPLEKLLGVDFVALHLVFPSQDTAGAVPPAVPISVRAPELRSVAYGSSSSLMQVLMDVVLRESRSAFQRWHAEMGVRPLDVLAHFTSLQSAIFRGLARQGFLGFTLDLGAIDAVRQSGRLLIDRILEVWRDVFGFVSDSLVRGNLAPMLCGSLVLYPGPRVPVMIQDTPSMRLNLDTVLHWGCYDAFITRGRFLASVLFFPHDLHVLAALLARPVEIYDRDIYAKQLGLWLDEATSSLSPQLQPQPQVRRRVVSALLAVDSADDLRSHAALLSRAVGGGNGNGSGGCQRAAVSLVQFVVEANLVGLTTLARHLGRGFTPEEATLAIEQVLACVQAASGHEAPSISTAAGPGDCGTAVAQDWSLLLGGGETSHGSQARRWTEVWRKLALSELTAAEGYAELSALTEFWLHPAWRDNHNMERQEVDRGLVSGLLALVKEQPSLTKRDWRSNRETYLRMWGKFRKYKPGFGILEEPDGEYAELLRDLDLLDCPGAAFAPGIRWFGAARDLSADAGSVAKFQDKHLALLERCLGSGLALALQRARVKRGEAGGVHGSDSTGEGESVRTAVEELNQRTKRSGQRLVWSSGILEEFAKQVTGSGRGRGGSATVVVRESLEATGKQIEDSRLLELLEEVVRGETGVEGVRHYLLETRRARRGTSAMAGVPRLLRHTAEGILYPNYVAKKVLGRMAALAAVQDGGCLLDKLGVGEFLGELRSAGGGRVRTEAWKKHMHTYWGEEPATDSMKYWTTRLDTMLRQNRPLGECPIAPRKRVQ